MDIGDALVRRPPPPAVRRTPLRVQKTLDGRYVATMTLPTQGRMNGAQVVVSIPVRALEGLLTIGGDSGAIVGSIFGDIAKGIGQVMTSDYVQGAASAVLAAYGVPPGITQTAMEAGGRLVESAAKGHPRARARLAQVQQQAAAGNPRARKAAAVLQVHQSSQQQSRAAMTLLNRAQSGDQRARARIQQIESAASRGDRRASRGVLAMRAVMNASRQAAGQAPPARRAAPPAMSAHGSRIVQVQPTAAGKHLVTIEVGGAGWNWLKQNFGFYRGYRPETEVFGLRDAYLMGLNP